MEKDNKSEAYLKNSLVMAYLGDSVFSLIVREYLVKNYEILANGLNKKANSVVCARFQAEIMEQLKPELKDDELDVVMRARNAHPNNKAKNSTLAEYCLATQFEALLGYWYLCGEMGKIENVFNRFVKEKL